MDRRYRPLSPAEQLEARESLLADIAAHPEWTVPEVVRQLRTRLHLTHADMARISSLSVATLRNLESGRSSPTLASVLQVLRPFGLDVAVVQRR